MINDKSIGPFYFAAPQSTTRLFWPDGAEINEMIEPWRRGKVLVLCTGTKRALAVGLWFRKSWMNPVDVSLDDISDWDNGAEATEEERRKIRESKQRHPSSSGEETL